MAPTPVSRRRIGRGALLLLIACAALGAGVAWRSRPLPVVATRVVRGRALEAVYATGTVEAEDRVQVKAKTSGSVAELLLKEGTRVKRGAVLARIDNPSVTFELERGRIDSSAAWALSGPKAPRLLAQQSRGEATRLELELASRDLLHVQKLVEGGSAPSADLDRAQLRVDQLAQALEAAAAEERALRIDLASSAGQKAAQLKSLAARLGDTEVRAPIDGVVLKKQVELGEVVAVNQALFLVGEVKRLILEVAVDEADVAKINDGRDGRPASVCAISLYAYPNRVFEGSLFEVLPDANRERKSFLAKVSINSPPLGLRSGMSAEVNLIAREAPNSLLSPSAAVNAGAVWLYQNGRVTRRPVVVGIRDLIRVQILDGLAEGDSVVVEGAGSLREGARVSVTERAQDKQEPVPDTSQTQSRGSL